MDHPPDPRRGAAGRSLIKAGRRLGDAGLITATEGNLSQRLPGGRLLITCSAVRKNDLAADQLLVVDDRGALLIGAGRPSSEMAIHLAAYQARADIGAVIHAHPPAATAFAVARRIPDGRSLAESLALLGPVILVPYARPGTLGLAQQLESSLAQANAFLLANHGALTVAADVETALQRMELLERLAQVQLHAMRLGGAVPLPPEEQAYLRGIGSKSDS